jgi:DNA-directed RNA polymerase specialized sigma24 family protein
MNARPNETCVTEWIGRLKAGDGEAARKLWEGYFGKLVALARQRLRAAPRAAADEEDVALSAFESFCNGAGAGRFPRLNDRQDLWQVLFLLTSRKAVSQARRERRQKRGGGQVVQASALATGDEANDAFAGVSGGEPTPEFAALVAEECDRLLNGLNDESLRQIAVWKMEGYTNAEIAVKIGRVEGTVERKLALIRSRWEAEAAS